MLRTVSRVALGLAAMLAALGASVAWGPVIHADAPPPRTIRQVPPGTFGSHCRNPGPEPRPSEPSMGPLLRYRFCDGWTGFPYPEAAPIAGADLAARLGEGLLAIWRWDNPTQRWQVFHPHVPDRVNGFDTIQHADALLVHMAAEPAALLRFQLPPAPTSPTETITLPPGWTAVPYRGRYGLNADTLLADLPPGSRALVPCDSRGPAAPWWGSVRNWQGLVHAVHDPFFALPLAYWDLVFFKNAGPKSVTVTLPTTSAAETFSRAQIPALSAPDLRRIAEVYETLTDPAEPAAQLAERRYLSIREDGRLWVDVWLDSPTTWAELTPLEFDGTLLPPDSFIGPGIPREQADVEGVLYWASLPVDRLLDVLLWTDLLPTIPDFIVNPSLPD